MLSEKVKVFLNYISFAGLGVLTGTSMKVAVFWVVTPMLQRILTLPSLTWRRKPRKKQEASKI
jgi:uncharacterized membrane protein